MRIITDRFVTDLPLAIVAGTFAADPLDGRDAQVLAHGWANVLNALGPLGDTMLTLREVVLAAYSLGARHTLERVDALGRANCASVPEEEGCPPDCPDCIALHGATPDDDDETICLGDEPKQPPQDGRAAVYSNEFGNTPARRYTPPACDCGADRTGPTAEAHHSDCAHIRGYAHGDR